MAQAPEIPEASDAFGKQVAVTIAILAVLLALIGNKGDNAKTDTILNTNEAAGQWGFYQAKSLKQNLCESEVRLLTLMPTIGEPAARLEAIAKGNSEAKRYAAEKDQIKIEAEKLVAAAHRNGNINNICDHASLGLQIGIVICSVAILSKWRALWFIGIALGVIGAVIGAGALMM